MSVWSRLRDSVSYKRWLKEIPEEPEEFIDYSVCDWAPEDLLLCGTCGGHGAILLRTDWEGGPEIEGCVRCSRTGLDPIQCPAWAVAIA